jgi:hypothetical protein
VEYSTNERARLRRLRIDALSGSDEHWQGGRLHARVGPRLSGGQSLHWYRSQSEMGAESVEAGAGLAQDPNQQHRPAPQEGTQEGIHHDPLPSRGDVAPD